MRHRLGRRRAAQNHPGLGQIDRLLAGHPDQLEVPISGLPGQVDKLFSLYMGLFEARDYRVKHVDRRRDDLWIARLERGEELNREVEGIRLGRIQGIRRQR